jgi:hypothetical protein
MIEGMGLKSIASRSLEWHYLGTKFDENLPSDSEVISGGNIDRHTDRQTGDSISLLSVFKVR